MDSSDGGDSDDAQSNECILSSGGVGDDLSSFDGDGEGADQDGGLPNMVELSLEDGGTDVGHLFDLLDNVHTIFWDPESALYKAVEEMVMDQYREDDKKKKCGATGACFRRLATPSQVQAEIESNQWLQKIGSLVVEKGSPEQQKMWNEAFDDYQNGLVSALFLPRELGGCGCGET